MIGIIPYARGKNLAAYGIAIYGSIVLMLFLKNVPKDDVGNVMLPGDVLSG